MTPRRGLVMLVALPLVAVLFGAPGSAAAQGGPSARMTVAPADVVFDPPSDFEFDVGWVDHVGVNITIEPRGNRPNWELFVQASAADMGGYGKPVQDILVRVQGSTSWTPLGTTAQLVGQGSGATTVTVYYRLLLDWTLDAPGSYTVPLEYTSRSF